MVETIKNKKNKKINQKRNKIGERESIDLFVVVNFEKIGERGVNEVRRNLYEN